MEAIQSMKRPSFSVYDASAGSGKTYTLVKEYLKIILSSQRNDPYRSILALTFTNKAVHEMKVRILSNLNEFATDSNNEKSLRMLQELEIETGISQVDLRKRAAQLLRYLIHNYASFDILTIDKFTYRVIRSFAYDFDLPITFEISLDTDSLLLEAVEAVISQAGEEPQITKLLLDFAIERADDDRSWDVSREVFALSKLLFSENNLKEIEELKDVSISEFFEIKKNIRDLVRTLENENQKLAQSALKFLDENNVNQKLFSYGTFPNQLNAIAQGKSKFSATRFTESEEVKINKTASEKERQEIIDLLPSVLEKLKVIYSNIDRINLCKAVLRNITPLSLLSKISEKIDNIQNERNIRTLSEFNIMIDKEIRLQPALFIYERIGEKYRHFFIDEFQDTSELQWRNLIPLIDNALSTEFVPGEQGSLMIVGDPKQSIYRWRGGKAEQFISLSKNENPFKNQPKECFHLDTNYRSYSAIIDFNNDFFKFLAGKFIKEDYKDLYENHCHQNRNHRVGGYVDITFVAENTQETQDEVDEDQTDSDLTYCKITAQKIQEVLGLGFSYSDIAVLTRKRFRAIMVAQYLSIQGIPLISSETLLVENSVDIQFIVNVLEYLTSNKNLEAKANILLYLAENVHEYCKVHDFVNEGMCHVNESDFEAWLLKFDISIIFDSLRKKSLYEVVEIILIQLMKHQERNSYIQCFLDLILNYQNSKRAHISDFLAYWREESYKHSVPSPEGTDAVKILTIHKSKGLEFPIVIMPFAEENYDKSPKEKLWIDGSDYEIDLPRILVDNNKSVTEFGPAANHVYEEQKQQELLDNINILYVALTRAEQQLYIISRFLKKKKDGDYPNNMASLFMAYLEQEGILEEKKLTYVFGKLEVNSKTPESTKKNIPILMNSSCMDPSVIRISSKEALIWGTLQESAIDYGNLIHRLMSKIIRQKDVKPVLENALQSGLLRYDQYRIVEKTLSKIVSHPELQPYFSDSNQIHLEQAILQKGSNKLIPDRIAINEDNEVFILDYKTGAKSSQHKIQLEKYQEVLELMKYKVKSKTLVYITEKIELTHI